MWLNKVLCLIHTPRVTINSTYSKRFVVRLYIYISPLIGWCISPETLKDSTIETRQRLYIISAATERHKRRQRGDGCHCDDCYCFILGSVHERICDVREKAAAAAAAGCWSVKRFATAFIHTQMRFIAPPRTSSSLHHSTTKSTSSALDDDAQSCGVRECRGRFRPGPVQTPQRRSAWRRVTRPLGAYWGGWESFEDGSAGIRTRTLPDPTRRRPIDL